jgi:curli biogenesis system outer membrane secretion channel CsgG
MVSKFLKRKNIRDIYNDEYEMPNLNQKTKPKTGQFLSAQYTVTGGITELGICEESSGNSVQLGGIISLLGGPSADLGVSQNKNTSKVKVVAQVVSVETGEILRSFEASSESNDSSFGVSGGAMGIGAGHNSRTRPPIEQATNRAIQDLSRQIAEYLKIL